jgi:mono/diheme cytochrome c family protein
MRWVVPTSRLILLWIAGTFVVVCFPQQQSGDYTQSASRQQTFVDQYCVSCHNDKLKTAGLALNAVSLEHVDQNPEVLEKVLRKLRGRYMPPPGLPRPDEHTYDAQVSSLETALDNAAMAKPDPGRTDTVRRLTRTEYHNAIRDLLGVEVDVAPLLPSDESSYGFDNVTVGNLSPTLLDRYLSAAEKISRLAVGIAGRSPGGDTFIVPPDLTQEDHFDKLPPGTRGGTSISYNFPVDGKYDIRLRLARDSREHIAGLTGPQDVELLLDRERVKLFTVSLPQPEAGASLKGGIPELDESNVDQGLVIRIAVKAGPHEIGATFPKRPWVLLDTERKPTLAHFNMDRHPRTQAALYSITINGPYEATGPGDTASRRRIFVCQPVRPAEEEICAKRILSTLMRHAYRRSVTDTDLRVPLKLYRDARAEGGFEVGIEMGLSAVLVSPEFLFRVEHDPPSASPNTAYSITDLELASRLSFFLWSSIPDDELLDLATRGKLRAPGVIEKQVTRMLADARSRALVSNFAEQWLYLRNLDSTTPDMRLFPDFDDNLRQAFREETELFFDSIMREDRGVPELLSANYTFVNERLAKHYGIPNVYGSRFRRVTFEQDGGRGGLLRQGSVLTVTSYATRTSPVVRGKWILDNILGVPPPPPPPAVPPLKENTGEGKALSVRERLALHRANQPCAGCHRLMDPVGFSLENYDAVGRWRAIDEGASIDVSGGLPDGRTFEGVSGLQQALLSRPELFVATFTEKLLTYALGRGVEYYDAPAVRKIVQEARAKDFRFSSVVLGIVSSTPFQMRRTQ